MVRDDVLGAGAEAESSDAGALLYRAMMANAAVTAACGAVALAGAGTWMRAFELSQTWLPYALGALYVGFGGLLALVAARRRPVEAVVVTALDAGYGLASLAALGAFPGVMNGAGREAIAAVAVLVAGFVTAQTVGIARVRKTRG